MGPPVALPIRRNTASLGRPGHELRDAAAVRRGGSLTLVNVLGVEGLLGLGPAIVLGSGAIAALPAGRAMDRVGRVPVLAGGFGGCARLCARRHRKRRVAGAARAAGLVEGAAGGIALLARAAAGDMYPPDRRARASRSCCSEPCSGRSWAPRCGQLDRRARAGRDAWRRSGWRRAPSWSWAALVACVRPDPRRIAELLEHEEPIQRAGSLPGRCAAPLKELLGRR